MTGTKWIERISASGRMASTMFCASGRERGSLSTSAPIEKRMPRRSPSPTTAACATSTLAVSAAP